MIKSILKSFFLLCLINLSIQVNANDYYVTTTSVSGPGSLSQALDEANNNPGLDQIFITVTGTIITNNTLYSNDGQHINIVGPGSGNLTIGPTSLGTFRIFQLGGNTTVTGLTIRNGRAIGFAPYNQFDGGGGIHYRGSTSMVLKDVNITGCTANQGNGGAISALYGGIIMENCVISNNISAYNTSKVAESPHGGKGGAIYLNGNLEAQNCAFTSNSVSSNGAGYGGAIYIDLNNNSSITNCLINSNSGNCTGGALGGGIFIAGGSVTVTSCTMLNNGMLGGNNINVLGRGGAFATHYGNFVVLHTLCTGNTAQGDTPTNTTYTNPTSNSYQDSGGSFTFGYSLLNDVSYNEGSPVNSLGFNICSNNSINSSLTAQGDRSNINLSTTLGNLGNYGGFIQTIPLLCGSPAINAVTISGVSPTLDQRGFARLGFADIGPFEYQTPSIIGISTALGCGASVLTLSGISNTGKIRWYNTLSGGAFLATTTSFITPSISATTTYYAEAFDGSCLSTSRMAVTGIINQFTTISNAPIASSVCIGANATFAVTALGAGTLAYQWRKDGMPVGTNSASITINSVSGTNLGIYTVSVSGTCGSVTSAGVALSTLLGTSIQNLPSNLVICNGSSTVLTATATGTNLTYLWSNGANTMSTNVSTSGTYLVTASGTCGTAISSPLVLNTTVCSAAITSIAIIFPSNIPSTFTGTSANITWPTLTGAATYCIRYSKSSNFGTTTKTVCGLNSANDLFVLSLAGLRASDIDEIIYYQVAGVDENENMSLWSETQSFNLKSDNVTSYSSLIKASEFVIYPNPTNGSFTIQNAPMGSTVEIYNLMGTLLSSQIISKEDYLMDLELSKSIYLVKIGTLTKKLVIE